MALNVEILTEWGSPPTRTPFPVGLGTSHHVRIQCGASDEIWELPSEYCGHRIGNQVIALSDCACLLWLRSTVYLVSAMGDDPHFERLAENIVDVLAGPVIVSPPRLGAVDSHGVVTWSPALTHDGFEQLTCADGEVRGVAWDPTNGGSVPFSWCLP